MEIELDGMDPETERLGRALAQAQDITFEELIRRAVLSYVERLERDQEGLHPKDTPAPPAAN